MYIKKEELFLTLFGFMITPYQEGFMVIDENSNQIGQILQIDKEHYQISVNTDLFHYEAIRRMDEKNTSYDFYIVYQGEKVRASIAIGEKRGIKIKSHSMGSLYLALDANSMFLEFDVLGSESIVTERIELKRKPYLRKTKEEDYEKMYSYYAKMKKKDKIGSNAIETTYFYSPKEEEGILKRKEVKYRNDHIATISTSRIVADFRETIQNHQLGLDAARKFSVLLNAFFSTKYDILSNLTIDLESLWEEIRLILSSMEEEKEESLPLVVNK